MNNLEDSQYINRLQDELESSRTTIMNEMKADKECTKERVLNIKLSCIDIILKSLRKYNNLKIKEKLKADL